jgi:hypothetical protein
VRRAEDELARALVVEVDEARVGFERLGDLRSDEVKHLLQVERRVDGRDRLREELQVALGSIHHAIVGATLPRGRGAPG